MRKNLLIFFSIGVLIFCSVSSAATFYYNSRSSFMSNSYLDTTDNINFDDISAGTDLTNDNLQGVTFQSPSAIPLTVIDATTGVRYSMSASSGSNLLSPGGSNTSQENDDLKLVFDDPVKAAGFDVVFDRPDQASYVSVSFYDINDTLIYYSGDHIVAPTNGYTFVGLVSDSVIIKSIVVNEWDGSADDDHVAYDSFVFSQAVPEPATITLLLLCMAGLFCKK